jgi:addiction module HigA family antidote
MKATPKIPPHPGEILLKKFLEPHSISQKQLVDYLGWTYARLNEIINMRRGVTAASALALSEAFGNQPEFWLDLQRDWDLWHARQTHVSVSPIFLPKNEQRLNDNPFF